MNPGDQQSMFVDELERALSDPAEPAAHEDDFRAQRQKTDRLNEYYADVVAELRALLEPDHVEGS
jgi:hypothetical protein